MKWKFWICHKTKPFVILLFSFITVFNVKGQGKLNYMSSFHRNSDSVEYQNFVFSLKRQVENNKFFAGDVTDKSVETIPDDIKNFEMKINSEKSPMEASVWPKQTILKAPKSRYPNQVKSSKIIPNDVIALIPTIFSLDSFVCYIGNQKNIYSCSAWASAGLKSIEDNIKNNRRYQDGNRKDTNNYFSPSYIYAKAKESIIDAGCTQGIDLLDAFIVLKQYGTPTLSTCPYFHNDYNCEIDNFSTYDAEAKNHRINNIVPVDVNLVTFKYAISHYSPIALEMNIDYDFIYQGQLPKWTKVDPFVWKEYLSSPKFGNRKPHSVICLGYNDNIGAFLMVNSFGEQFGNRGFFFVDYDFLFKKNVVKQAYLLKSDIYDSSIINDRRKINEINNSKIVPEDGIKFELIEGQSMISIDNLKVKGISQDFGENSIQVKIFGPDGKVIRKNVSVPYGACVFFTYRMSNYYLILLDLRRSSTGDNSTIASLIMFKRKK